MHHPSKGQQKQQQQLGASPLCGVLYGRECVEGVEGWACACAHHFRLNCLPSHGISKKNAEFVQGLRFRVCLETGGCSQVVQLRIWINMGCLGVPDLVSNCTASACQGSCEQLYRISLLRSWLQPPATGALWQSRRGGMSGQEGLVRSLKKHRPCEL